MTSRPNCCIVRDRRAILTGRFPLVNGSKYFSDNYIFVANESTIERQKSVANREQIGPRSKSDDDWVARILEIRASDEHHVYARVYWMYWPDELPANTLDGKKYISGRQPYHGLNELIASNHSGCRLLAQVMTIRWLTHKRSGHH